LSSFGKVFTLNYDLLLYWVILGRQQFADGFGLGTESNGFRGPFKTSARCNIDVGENRARLDAGWKGVSSLARASDPKSVECVLII
jgi:hypothetical protein